MTVGLTGASACYRLCLDNELVRNCDRGADTNGPKEIFRHEVRHANAAMGSRIARKISSVHSDTSVNTHKIWHRRTFKMSARRLQIDAQFDVRFYHVVGRIDVIAVFCRNMVYILLLNGEVSDRGVQSFTSRGKLRDSCQFATLVEVGPLFGQADFHTRFSVDAVTVPIRNVVLRGARRNRAGAINAAQILRLSGKPGVLSATGKAADRKNHYRCE